MTDAVPRLAEAVAVKLFTDDRGRSGEVLRLIDGNGTMLVYRNRDAVRDAVAAILADALAPLLARAASDREALGSLEALVRECDLLLTDTDGIVDIAQDDGCLGLKLGCGPTLLEALAAAGRRAR